MKFEVNAALGYNIYDPSTLVLNLHALRTPHQTVLEESLVIEPYMKVEELMPPHSESRFVRLDIQNPGDINVTYKAVVDNSCRKIDLTSVVPVPIAQLDSNVLPYLFPSRYCQSDKLYRFASKKFGNINNTFSQVLTLTDWIYANVEYLSGSTNSQTSAYDTATEQAGVCRDFAHLGIALCRALNIPARYFTGYAYLLKPPDFHACFEAFIGKDWILFDATKLAPLNGMVKIATGRDAADTAIASIFGNVYCNNIAVSCVALENNFEQFYYESNSFTGISIQ